MAEYGDVGHGVVKSDSRMEQGVVGRDQARRGQPVAMRKPPPEGPRDAGTTERV